MPSPHPPRGCRVHPAKRDQLEIFATDKIPVQSVIDQEVYCRDEIKRQRQQIEDEGERQEAECAQERRAESDAPRRAQRRIVLPLDRGENAVEEEAEREQR